MYFYARYLQLSKVFSRSGFSGSEGPNPMYLGSFYTNFLTSADANTYSPQTWARVKAEGKKGSAFALLPWHLALPCPWPLLSTISTWFANVCHAQLSSTIGRAGYHIALLAGGQQECAPACCSRTLVACDVLNQSFTLNVEKQS